MAYSVRLFFRFLVFSSSLALVSSTGKVSLLLLHACQSQSLVARQSEP